MTRLLSKKEVRQIVLLSPAHITRLEAAGEFPKRVRLGNHRSSRVGWVEDEVQEWLAERIREREPKDIPVQLELFAPAE